MKIYIIPSWYWKGYDDKETCFFREQAQALSQRGHDITVMRITPLSITKAGKQKWCEKTVIHKNTSKKFKKIVNSVEAKSVPASKVADKLLKIENKKHPKYVYSLNRNFLLKLLNILPARWQVKIIGKILKSK